MLPLLAFLALLPGDPAATRHAGDGADLVDAMRPVTRIGREGFSLQYVTNGACESAVEVREGEIPRIAFGLQPDGKPRLVQGAPGNRRVHRIDVGGLKPGKRYFYRVVDPSPKTAREKAWGADDRFGREFAVSTLAPKGRKTIIHLPVKVLLMPNVINVESAYADPAKPAPLPPKVTPEEIERMKEEYAVSARFLWVNSGMRLWVDYQFQIDDRWQRWGPQPMGVDPFYRGWPASRSWAGVDYAGPGGGDFTIVDRNDPLRVTKTPVVEARPYSGQIEMAWPRKWNPAANKWEFYNSGGGTYGVDSFPDGFPGRSQFLGGGDSAWLATHEFHHQLESHGQFSLSDREDDRIVFNHYAARQRTVKPDGSVEENVWTTSGRHGEHWDGMAFWDRQLSDAQWLRFYFGYTTTVVDADSDGLPDDDQRLPLDERRFGSTSFSRTTDGQMGDLAKAMLSTWVPGPLQTTWIKPPYQGIVPNPRLRDNDGDGFDDLEDPYPLLPNLPLIPYMRAAVDGDDAEWAGLPEAAKFSKGGIDFTFRQAHDEGGYSGTILVKGPWKRIDATFDGEGLGVYSGVGVLGFQLTRNGDAVSARPQFAGAPGLKMAAKPIAGGTVIEFRLPNRAEGPWFWTRGGREIGAVLSVWDEQNRGYSAWEPYRPFYARMLEPNGEEPLPSNPPAELGADADVRVLKPGSAEVQVGSGWAVADGVWKHQTGDDASLVVGGLAATDFDLWMDVEAKGDAILGAFTSSMKEINAGVGYIGFVGGYGNTLTKMRLFGQEVGESRVVMTPGRHRVQLSRRGGDVWLLVDGKPVVYAADPAPTAVIDRLAVLGGYGGEQVVREIRVRN